MGLRSGRRLCSSSRETQRSDKVLKSLAVLGDADPNALGRVSRALSSRTLKVLEDVVARESQTLAASKPPRPTNRQLLYAWLAPMPLFVVFGIIDNAVMIVAGETFDRTLGIAFGMSTMAAAALGNLVSDVLGLGVGGVVETWFERTGFSRDPMLTRAQEGMSIVRRTRLFGNAVGVSIGCLIGMFPLLFMDFDSIARLKERSRLDDVFSAVVEYVSEALGAESAALFLVNKEKGVFWTKASFGEEEEGPAKEFPLSTGVIGHCAKSGDVINISDPEDLKRFGSPSNLLTGAENSNVLCTPVFDRKGAIIGVIRVSNREDATGFNIRDEVALTAMSSHISCALERASKDDHDERLAALTDKDYLLRALRASFEHHQHHLRFTSSRMDGKTVSLVPEK